MYLVDNVNPLFALGGTVLNLLPDLTNIVNAVVGSGIDLGNI